MKNVKTMYRKLTMMVVLGVLLAVMSCNNLLTPPKGNSTDRDSGSGNVSEDGKVLITLKLFTGSARMVMPDIEQLDWHITAEQGTDSIPATGTYPTYTLELPTTGPWAFTVKGTKENKELFTGTATENVSNSTTSISIPLSPGSGMTDGGATGTLSLPIELINVCYMNLTYRINDGEWVKVEFDGSGKVSIFKNDLSVGQHTLDLYFGGGSKFYFCTVAVNIWPGMTSDRWIKTNGEEYIDDNGEFVITEEMVNEFVKTMGSVVFVDASVNTDEPATGSIFAPVNSVSTAVDILRKANPGGKCNGTIMVSGETTIDREIEVLSGETLTVKGTGPDASIKNTSGRVFNIASDGSLTLGENITLTGTNDTGNGGAVYVNGGTFTMEDGSKITGSSAKYGGGVYVDSKGTFTMGGGTISENDASGNGASGGGVCISGGTFTMSGGAVISKNSAGSSGGGVFVSDSGDFIMEGGTIGGTDGKSHNSAENGGGVYIFEGTFTMSGGAVISGNRASSSSSSGGGVYIFEGTFTMSDSAVISGNSATSSGGGVYVSTDGTFTMKGGTIGGADEASANSSESGGGVCVYKGYFTMSDGSISRNIAPNSGGGVFVQDGTFTMNGGIITRNRTDGNGAGVYLGGANAKVTLNNTSSISGNVAASGGGGVYVFGGTFTVSGSSLTITGNTAHNVYLANGNIITIGDEGLTGSTIGVTAEEMGQGNFVPITDKTVDRADTIFTSDVNTYSIAEYKGAVYLSDAETKYVGTDGTETFGAFETALAAVNSSADGGTITLLKDIDDTNAVFGTGNDTPITFKGSSESISFILDLNGKTIDRGLSTAATDGSVIKIEGGALTIKDSSATNPDGTDGTGTITGGNSSGGGGGIHITSNSVGNVPGSLILESGSIRGNTAGGSNGGGVYVNGGTFTMNGGGITGNESDGNGGGVYLDDTNAKVTLNNTSSISGNVAAGEGGGVYVGNGTFTLSGSPNISRNGLDGLNNVYLTSGKTISIGAGGLNTSARIGVTTATSPAAGTEVRITDTAVDGAESIFIPDAEGCIIMSKEDAVYLADSSSFEVSWDTGSGVQYGSFADGISALNTSGSGGTITLQKNIDGTNAVFSSDGGTTANDQPITFSGGAEASPVILDLNGCTIDRGLGTAQADGTVISVSGALTLKDSTGSGKITGGNNNNSTISGTWGGGVCVQNGAFFTMEGGNISCNFSEIGGGGVYVCNGGSFTMTDGTIGGSDVNDANMDKSISYGGGGVFVNGKFTMSGGTITRNITDANGGGVAVTADGTFTMSGTAVISANEASGGSGGGVYSAADFTMTGGTISSNTATGGGGVYMINSKKITMDGGAISGNIATTNGGGLYLYDGSTAEIGKNTSGSAPQISNNAATNDGTAGNDNAGGGIYLAASSSVEFTRGTISSNTVGEGTGSTSSQGGGVYIGSGSTFIMDGESAIIENNKINSNIGAGGGVCVVGGELTMSAGSITGNNAGGSGGGVYVDGGSSNFTMTNGKISGNSASFGGGVTVGSAGTFTISSPAVVSGNTISSIGGENVYVSTGGKFIDDDNCVTEGVEEQQ